MLFQKRMGKIILLIIFLTMSIVFLKALEMSSVSAYSDRWDSPFTPDLLGSSNGKLKVNPATGGISITATDLVLPGRDGFNFAIKRRYSSNEAVFDALKSMSAYHFFSHSFGNGWNIDLPFVKGPSTVSVSSYFYPYQVKYFGGNITLPGGSVMKVSECVHEKIDGPNDYEGKNVFFDKQSGYRYEFDLYKKNLITYEITNRKLISKNGTVYYVNEYGFVEKIESPDKKSQIRIKYKDVTSNSTSSNYKKIIIDYIEDSMGRIYRFNYDSNNIKIKFISIYPYDGTTTQYMAINYFYNSNGFLESVSHRNNAGETREIASYSYMGLGQYRDTYYWRIITAAEDANGNNGYITYSKDNSMTSHQQLKVKSSSQTYSNVISNLYLINKSWHRNNKLIEIDWKKLTLQPSDQGGNSDTFYNRTEYFYHKYVYEHEQNVFFGYKKVEKPVVSVVQKYLDKNGNSTPRVETWNFTFGNKKNWVHHKTDIRVKISMDKRNTQLQSNEGDKNAIIAVVQNKYIIDNSTVEITDVNQDIINKKYSYNYGRDDVPRLKYLEHEINNNLKKVINYEYDNLNKPIKITSFVLDPPYPSNTHKKTVEFSYDIWGNVLTQITTLNTVDADFKPVTRISSKEYMYNTLNTSDLNELYTKTFGLLTNYGINNHLAINLPVYQKTIKGSKVDHSFFEYNTDGELTGIAKSKVNSPASAGDFLATRLEYLQTGDVNNVIKPNGTVISIDYSDEYLNSNFRSISEYTKTKKIIYTKNDENVEVLEKSDSLKIDMMSGNILESGTAVDTQMPYYKYFLYDGWGRVIQTSSPSTSKKFRRNIVTFSYDENNVTGEKWQIINYNDENNNSHSIRTNFNNIGKLTSKLKDGVEIARFEYNASGKVIIKTYQDIETTNGLSSVSEEYTYSNTGKIKEIDLNMGTDTITTSYEYNYLNNYFDIKKYLNGDVSNTLGGITRVYYDVNNKTLKTIADYGKTLSTNPDAKLNITQKVYYDSAGRVEKTVDPDLYEKIYEYNEMGLLRRIKIPDVELYRFKDYDINPDTASVMMENEYDEYGRLINKKNSLFNGYYVPMDEINYKYDGLNRIIETSTYSHSNPDHWYNGVTSGEGFEEIKVKQDYDIFGNVINITDPMNNQTQNIYNYYNLTLEKTIDADNNEYGYEYDILGNIKKTIDPRSKNETYPGIYETQIDYDYFHNKVSSVLLPKNYADDPDSIVETEYYDNGLIKSQRSPEGRVLYYTYNNFGKVEYILNADPINTAISNCWITKYEYDKLGRVKIERSRNGSVTEYFYDNVDRVIKIVNSKGGWKAFKYNKRSNVIEESSSEVSEPTLYEYNALGLCTKVTYPGDRVYQYGYNHRGNLTYMKDPLGLETKYYYNEVDKLLKEKDSEGKEIFYEYNLNGNLTKKKDKEGNIAVYSYSPTGRLLREDIKPADGSLTYFRIYYYDEAGALKIVRERCLDKQSWLKINVDWARNAYVPDVNNNIRRHEVFVQSVTDNFKRGIVTVYEYDRDGLMTSILYPNHSKINYSYDNLGRVKSVSGFINNITYENEIVSTDSLMPASINLNNGLVKNYSYSSIGELESESIINIPNMTEPVIKNYQYDNAGRIKSISGTFINTVYNYDDKKSLKDVDSSMSLWTLPDQENGETQWQKLTNASEYIADFNYDENNNLTRINSQVDSVYNGTSFNIKNDSNKINYLIHDYSDHNMLIYDKNGNLNHFFDENGVNNIYDFDADKRLFRYRQNYGNTIKNFYSPDGIRAAKYNTATNEVTSYAYMGNLPLYEEKDNGDYIQYVYLNGKVVGYYDGNRKDGTRNQYFTETDHIGSIVNTFDNSGDIVSAVSYNEHGEVLKEHGDSIRFWAGKKYDEDINLYYFNHRWYDPNTARFISEDPIKDGLNWYAYCGNDPVNFIDPSGLEAWGNLWDNTKESFKKNIGFEYRESYGEKKFLKDKIQFSCKNIYDIKGKVQFRIQLAFKQKIGKNQYVGIQAKGTVGLDFVELFCYIDDQGNYNLKKDVNFDYIIRKLEIEEFVGAEVKSEMTDLKGAVELKGTFHEFGIQAYNLFFSREDFSDKNIKLGGVAKISWGGGNSFFGPKSREIRVKFDIYSFFEETLGQLAYDLVMEDALEMDYSKYDHLYDLSPNELSFTDGIGNIDMPDCEKPPQSSSNSTSSGNNSSNQNISDEVQDLLFYLEGASYGTPNAYPGGIGSSGIDSDQSDEDYGLGPDKPEPNFEEEDILD